MTAIRGLRTYVAVIHEKHGVLLLQTHAKTKSTAAHFELPGGRVRRDDYGEKYSRIHGGIVVRETARTAAARHLFEETSIDIREGTDKMRLEYLDGSEKEGICFFVLKLSDADIPDLEESWTESLPMQQWRLTLSERHASFIFVKDPRAAAVLIIDQAGGRASEALRKHDKSSVFCCLC